MRNGRADGIDELERQRTFVSSVPVNTGTSPLLHAHLQVLTPLCAAEKTVNP